MDLIQQQSTFTGRSPCCAAAAAAMPFDAGICWCCCSVFAVGDVKLVANIIGDVLTSLAKPLGDLQYLMCYLRQEAGCCLFPIRFVAAYVP